MTTNITEVEMFDYLKRGDNYPIEKLDADELGSLAYMLLVRAYPLLMRAVQEESNEHLSAIYHSSLDDIESAMESLS